MPPTRSDFVLMLGFYHNFSITSPKKIHVKFLWCWKRSVSSLLSIIFIHITERKWVIYLLSTGWSSCPYVRTNHRIFMWIFQWQTPFHWAMAPTKLRPNPIGFFPVGAFKKYDFCHSFSHHRRIEVTYYHGNSEHYSENIAKGFPKYDALWSYM